MMLPQYKILLFVIATALGAVAPVMADGTGEFQFFKDPELDFWKKQPVTVQSVLPKKAAAVQEQKTSFPWGKYLSPKNDEFFKEGDYTPPAPFMEIARNPTDENIDNWFRYLNIKNELMGRLQKKLSEYAQNHPQKFGTMPEPYTNALGMDPSVLEKAASRVETGAPVAPDAKRFRLRLYFDSHCPHCERMMGTIRELMDRGYWVELRQVDKDVSARAKIPFSVTEAQPDELKRYQIESVPVLLVGDLKAKTYFKIQGYQTTGSVEKALSEKR